MIKRKGGKEKPKSLILGDDAIETVNADWFDFETSAMALTEQLYEISKYSGICCGIGGSWGSGKSSFMKLMKEHVYKAYPKKACVAWFTAWDPAGIDDLGDAMLYRLFHDVTESNSELSNAFKRLKEALGIRVGIREHALRALGLAQKAVPDVVRPAMEIAGGLLELDSPREVEESFNELMKWLEENDRTVFFFIDDLDRAKGEQIRDLLSELKVYISHRRIVAVLGYDEEYVLNALKSPVLPEGIDPKRYVEKIVTIRKNLPVPGRGEQIAYADNLIQAILHVESNVSRKAAIVATKLSRDNPRTLKNLILKLTNAALSMKKRGLDYQDLVSLLIALTLADMGLLSFEDIRSAVEMGDEESITSTLKNVANRNPSRAEEIATLARTIEYIAPNFDPRILDSLRLYASDPSLPQERTKEETGSRFEWKTSLFPILSNAAKLGFQFPQRTVEASESGVGLEADARLDDISFMSKVEVLRSRSHPQMYSLATKTLNIDVLLTSSLAPEEEITVHALINHVFAECPTLASDQSYALWMIDDASLLSKEEVDSLKARAREKCKGLKHSFIFQYTSVSNIQSLLTFLLNVAGSKVEKSK